ncbi:MAG TPA: IclR family transcriptional regulator [Ktedonobacteraceae bacterium]|nr:IclR family transcriptional regulator [Ktedonobacteraceae bacterium]
MKQELSRTAEAAPQGRNATTDRTIDVLLLFNEQQPVLTAEEISERLKMPRSTTYRYLQSLRSYGLVEENDSSGGFRLGLAVLRLARTARQGMDLSTVSLPLMQELVAQTGETALLTRRTDAYVVCIERVESQHRVRLSYERGQVLPLHAGASAKVLLAYLAPEEIEAILRTGPFPRYTEQTVTDPDVLRTQLESIRTRGYAMSEGEVDDGVRGVAAPIFDTQKRVIAGLSVAGPAFRINQAVLPGVIQAVQETAKRISLRLQELDL